MLIGMGPVSFSGGVTGFDILLGLGNEVPRFVSGQPQVFSKKFAGRITGKITGAPGRQPGGQPGGQPGR